MTQTTLDPYLKSKSRRKSRKPKYSTYYKCQYCGAMFKEGRDLLRHKKRCPFAPLEVKKALQDVCDYCGEMFNSPEDLIQHMLTSCPKIPKGKEKQAIIDSILRDREEIRVLLIERGIISPTEELQKRDKSNMTYIG